jgi:hypothetical protein
MEENLQRLEDEQSDTSTEVAGSWNSSQESLLVSIADRCNCMRWMHSRCQSTFETWNLWLTLPNIAVSAIAGSATMGITSLFSFEEQKTASTVLGLLTISCGVLTSINQHMKTLQNAEAHRAASLGFGKLYRVISSELALRRDQRLHALDFIKFVRAEQDKLQDSSPAILDSVVCEFRKQFKDTLLQKPEIVDLLPSHVNRAAKPGSTMNTKSPTLPITPIQKNHSELSLEHEDIVIDVDKSPTLKPL